MIPGSIPIRSSIILLKKLHGNKMRNHIDFIDCDSKHMPQPYYRMIYDNEARERTISREQFEEEAAKINWDDPRLLHTAFPFIVVLHDERDVILNFANIFNKMNIDSFKCYPNDVFSIGLAAEDIANAVGRRDALWGSGIYPADDALCKKIKDNEDAVLQMLNTQRDEEPVVYKLG